MDREKKIIVGISAGDINGIGPEVILNTFKDNRMLDFCTPVIFGSTKVFSFHKKSINSEVHLNGIQKIDQLVHGKINVLNLWKEEIKIELGKATKNGGEYAAKSLAKAIDCLKNNEIDFLLTAPINKDTIQSETFNYPGHTEFLADKLDGESLMILLQDTLRVGLVTGHVPVSEITNHITTELIEKKTNILHQSLKEDFNINKPKIAILALNPHAGDNGVLGNEEKEIIKPAIEKIKESGKLVFGPYAADGFFGSKTYQQFDAVLAMYHDQGLAPFKALAFGNGVNFTAGLNKVRVSPDHGTGFDIAGKGIASEESFKEALFTGLSVFKNRSEYKELTKNVLETKNS